MNSLARDKFPATLCLSKIEGDGFAIQSKEMDRGVDD